MREAREFCGLFGVFGHPEAVHKTFYGLYSLQHRGQESAGIVTTDGRTLQAHRGMGLVGEIFDADVLAGLKNDVAIGHVRYSTTGSSTIQNAQPLLFQYAAGPLAIAHNGNLVNSGILRREFEERGSIFQTSTDSEIIMHLLAQPSELGDDERLIGALRQLRGAFSLLLLTPTRLYAIRDRHGFRPLCLGVLDGVPVAASESCALDVVGASYVRDVEPGEVVEFSAAGERSFSFAEKPETPAHCVFEHVYFARPDSLVFGENVHRVRMELGRRLAREHPVKADLVIPIPDSGNDAALGYSHESGIPLEHGFVRNHYVGRTFIQPTQGARIAGVGLKLNPIPGVVRGKKLVVVDDSIIRGTTSRGRVRLLRQCGAAEIHMRISCPPIAHPCYYGIDFPNPAELVAARMSVEEIRRHLELDSLGYLSLDGLLGSVSHPPAHYCTACYSGRYPVPVADRFSKLRHEEKC
ncbi:MAG: amidophosphoribosyltransferase [Candidatus Brocadiae bacterium]|nr:amidophosphoribosyltransferase [Candidatus Brocadiia bacterium]